MSRDPYRRPDVYSRQAKARGYAARSVFKLEEIDQRVRLLRRGQRVLDLGASPGSWAQYACGRIGPQGRLLAADRNPLTVALPAHAQFVISDVLADDPAMLATFAPYNVVLSDMAPSTTGTAIVDQARSLALFLRAVEIADQLACPHASFVGKLFMSGDFDEARSAIRARYASTRTIKPAGTRSRSVEVYLVGENRV
jgi:23S rRNA (uridine2552-2'-O)-methyltransferase